MLNLSFITCGTAIHQAEGRVNLWMCYFFPYSAIPEQLLACLVKCTKRRWLQLLVPVVSDTSNGNRYDEGTIDTNSAFLIKLQTRAEAWKMSKSVASQGIMILNQDFL